MVPIVLRVFVAVVCVILASYIVRLIAHGRLQLKYSLIWFAFCIVVVLCVVFPDPLFALAGLLGFEQPSNFIFFVGLGFALAIVLSLTVAISWQARYIVSLMQDLALLRHEMDEREKRR